MSEVRAAEADMPAAFERIGELIREGRDDLILTTGPSATADMGALVKGAHGPREVHVVLIERGSGDGDDGVPGGQR
jgi:L-lactate dehydrogenase complex protein LldG